MHACQGFGICFGEFIAADGHATCMHAGAGNVHHLTECLDRLADRWRGGLLVGLGIKTENMQDVTSSLMYLLSADCCSAAPR